MVMTQKDIITILAIIGALVVLGFVLRVTFALLGPLLLIGLAYIVYTMMKKGGGR
jgi:predicted membrane protein